MKPYHNVENIQFSGEFMVLTIDGEEITVKLKDVSTILDRASEKEKSTFEISPSGYGIHWPLIDEDVAIDGLLGIVHTRELKRKTA
ncbi:MAG: DUF2442 domain-containing protein [Syntrophus sp. (in: bacteria)]|nr:DUF2442 domain-containing protein [Syntrophus sp. (in: bacteria)]